MKRIFAVLLFVLTHAYVSGQFTHSFPEAKCVQCDYADKAYPPVFNWPSPKANLSTVPKYMMVTGPASGGQYGDPTSTPTSIALVSTGEYSAPTTIFGSGDMYRMKVDKVESVSFRTEFYIGSGGGGSEAWGYSDAKWFMAGIYIPSDWCDDTRPMGIFLDMKYPDAVGPPSFFITVKNGYFQAKRKFPQNGSEIITDLFQYEKGKWHYFLLHRNFTETTNPGNVEGGSGGYMVLRYWKSGTTPSFATVWSHYGGNYVNYSTPSLTEGYWLIGPYNWPWNANSEGSGPCNTSLTLFYKHIFSAKSTATLTDFNNFISGTTGGGANEPPVANAGANQTIAYPGTSTTLNGTGSSDADGTITTRAWTKVSGGSATIVSPSSASTSVTGMVPGSYVFRLTVTDDDGASSSDDINVTVNASGGGTDDGPHFTVGPGGGCSPSSYGDGGCPATAVPDLTITDPTTTTTTTFYAVHGDDGRWIQQFTVTLLAGYPGGTSPTEEQVSQDAGYIPEGTLWQFGGMTADGVYTFEVTAQDNLSDIVRDTFTITRSGTANAPPAVSAGPDISLYINGTGVFQSASTTLFGTSSDDNGISGILWSRISGADNTSFGTPTSDTTTFTMLSVGIYVVRKTVVDGLGASSFDDATITVITCNAGPDTTVISVGGTTSCPLVGTVSGGTVASVLWTKVSGTGGSITSSTSLATAVTGLTPGNYTFQLQITFTDGNVVIDNKEVIVVSGNPTLRKVRGPN